MRVLIIFLLLTSVSFGQTLDAFPDTKYTLFPIQKRKVYESPPKKEMSYIPPLIIRDEYGNRLRTYEYGLQGTISLKDSTGLITAIYKRDWQGNIVLIKR